MLAARGERVGGRVAVWRAWGDAADAALAGSRRIAQVCQSLGGPRVDTCSRSRPVAAKVTGAVGKQDVISAGLAQQGMRGFNPSLLRLRLGHGAARKPAALQTIGLFSSVSG
jgi:hypothetical protein